MGKTLRADIVIGGKADSSFYKLGNELQTLGSQVNLISEKLIQFGKESVEAYTSYEDYMLDAEVALKTQYESTSQLGKVMGELQKASLQWARDSRFTTEDVAGAISNAAHAGWNLEQILNGVPSAMKLSLAGSMDLAQGLEYLVDISNAAGIGFEELGNLTDYWSYAANRSSTTIPEMGAAMQKMGATLQFVKGDMAGLTTMLAVLANNGTKGTEAGTLLRNSMIRMIAPTKAAADAMDLLGMTADELDEIYTNSKGLEETNALLKEAGFSAYNAKGDLKSFLEIFQDLDRVTSSMTEEQRNDVLSTIFPTRTITGALALLDAASSGWDGLYESIQENASGYTDYAAEKMESGLGGTLRHLESVYNTLQTRTGKELSEPVGNVADFLSSMIESVNDMDDASFGALVSGLEVVAVAGPGLMVAGGALKLIEALLGTGPVGQLILAGIALTAMAAGMNKLNEAEYEDQFGDLQLDADKIRDYVSSIGKEFEQAQEGISKYTEAVETAFGEYETASSALNENLLTKMLSSAVLTQEDIRELNGLGDQMRQALLSGIQGSHAKAESALVLLSGEDVLRLSEDDDSLWSGILDTLDYGYAQVIARAEQLGNELRDAMTSAFTDGSLSSEEINGILSIQNQMNELFAMQVDAQNAMEREKLLRNAQTLGLDGMEEISGMVQAQRESELAALEDNYWQTYYQTKLGGEWKIQNGVKKADGTLYTQEDLNRELEALYSGDPNDPTDGYLGKMNQISAAYDRMLLDLYGSTLNSSELGDAYRYTLNLAEMVSKGLINPDDAHTLYRNKLGNNRYAGENDSPLNGDTTGTQLGKTLETIVGAFGGLDALQQRISYLEDMGDLDTAAQLRKIYALEQIANNFSAEGVYGTASNRMYWGASNRDNFDDVMGNSLSALSAESAKQMVQYFGGENGNVWKYFEMIGNAAKNGGLSAIQSMNMTSEDIMVLNSIMSGLQSKYDFNKLLEGDSSFMGYDMTRNEYAAYRLMFDESINPNDYLNQNVTVPVIGDTSSLQASIASLDGSTIGVNVVLNGISGMGGITVRGGIGGPFADGGRADMASIFGEAGPEWAIPEEHSQRTAELLNAAREASGFSWPELLSRNGGLNAGSSGNWTLVYSPTIVSDDASGVEEKLKADKDWMEKWWRDQKFRDDVEVYA